MISASIKPYKVSGHAPSLPWVPPHQRQAPTRLSQLELGAVLKSIGFELGDVVTWHTNSNNIITIEQCSVVTLICDDAGDVEYANYGDQLPQPYFLLGLSGCSGYSRTQQTHQLPYARWDDGVSFRKINDEDKYRLVLNDVYVQDYLKKFIPICVPKRNK